MVTTWTQGTVTVAALVAVLVSAGEAAAQDGRVFIDINGGTQATSTDFTDNVVFTEFVEEGDFDATYGIDSGLVVDISGGVAVGRRLAVGVGYSRFDKRNGASVDARIPHPFFFDRDRSIAGAAANLARTETAVHVQLRWFAPLGGRVSLSLFGGPTFFRVTQGLVTTVDFSQSYPFDDASFTSASTGDRSESALGYNVGVDAGFFFSRYIGVGVLARFARASVDLVSEDTGLVSIDTGGFHAGGGLRLRF
jgi:hypothetical protein